MLKELPIELLAVLDWRHPDWLDGEYVRHSHECYTVTIMDMNYQHFVWRCHLSLDHRWTLSPVYVPCDTSNGWASEQGCDG